MGNSSSKNPSRNKNGESIGHDRAVDLEAGGEISTGDFDPRTAPYLLSIGRESGDALDCADTTAAKLEQLADDTAKIGALEAGTVHEGLIPNGTQLQSPEEQKKRKRRRIAIYLLLGGASIATTAAVLAWKLTQKNDPNDNPSPSPDVPTLPPLEQFLVTGVPDDNNNQTLVPLSYVGSTGLYEWICTQMECSLSTAEGQKQQAVRALIQSGMYTAASALWQIWWTAAGNPARADDQTKLIYSGRTADANPKSNTRPPSNHLKSPSQTPTLGGGAHTYITGESNALLVSIIPVSLQIKDPLAGIAGIPADATYNIKHFQQTSYDTAMAIYIGPLQQLYQQFSHHLQDTPLTGKAMTLAHGVLVSVNAQLSPDGAMFYSTSAVPNLHGQPINPNLVLYKGMFATIAAQTAYQTILSAQPAGATFPDGSTVDNELAVIKRIIHGDSTDNGILDFIKHQGLDPKTGLFPQGGFTNTPNTPETFMPFVNPTYDPMTDLEGLAIIGPTWISQSFKKDIGYAYQMWQKVKAIAGYYQTDGSISGPIQGLGPSSGHSDIDGEMSMAAVNTCRVLAQEYENLGRADLAESLRADAASILSGVNLNLNTAHYQNQQYDVPDSAKPHLKNGAAAIMGSLRRLNTNSTGVFFSPYPDISGPIPNTAATARMALALGQDGKGYNPMFIGGGYQAVITSISSDNTVTATISRAPSASP